MYFFNSCFCDKKKINYMLCNCNFIVYVIKYIKSEVKFFEVFLLESDCLLIICKVCFINKLDI